MAMAKTTGSGPCSFSPAEFGTLPYSAQSVGHALGMAKTTGSGSSCLEENCVEAAILVRF